MYLIEEALPLKKRAKLLLLYTSVTTRINRANIIVNDYLVFIFTFVEKGSCNV